MAKRSPGPTSSTSTGAVEDDGVSLGAGQIEQVRSHLRRICESTTFAQSERMKAFLGYVVEETLAGRADRLKAFAIGVQVYGRDDSFDPGSDPIVRVDAGRLRRKLRDYYAGEGRSDRLRIDLPKGAYVPTFEAHEGRAAAGLPLDLPRGPVVAVLPFVDMSRDADQGHFSDGITEEIITQRLDRMQSRA